MTQDQAAQLIEQQAQLLDLYRSMVPLFSQVVRDLFPVGAVSMSLLLGVVLGVSCT